jgi:DNA invertase Pin-like site-specific DNA recombinase
MICGYARVSSAGQDTTVQREALAAAGCDVIHEERASGTSRNGREQLRLLLGRLRRGDTLVVTRLDRLARSLADLIDITRQLEERGAALKVLQQPVDTSTPAGRMFFAVLGAIAQFETELRAERQAEGIRKAKARGAYRGRKSSIDASTVRQLHASGAAPAAIAEQLAVSTRSVYRAIARQLRQMPQSIIPAT